MSKNLKVEKCKFHPDKFAHVRCKTCFIPLCDDCKIVTEDGIFCSEECHAKASHFRDKVMPHSLVQKKSGFPIGKIIGGIIVIAILLALLAAGLQYLGVVNIPIIADLLSSAGL